MDKTKKLKTQIKESENLKKCKSCGRIKMLVDNTKVCFPCYYDKSTPSPWNRLY